MDRLGYLYYAPHMDPVEMDPVETELAALKAAGSSEVYQDWGSRSYLEKLHALIQEHQVEIVYLRRLEDAGDTLAQVHSFLSMCQSAGTTIQLVTATGSLIPPDSATWIQLLSDLPSAVQRRQALNTHAQNRLNLKPPPGSPPFGYRREQDRYVLDRRQAAIVKDFFNHFLLYGSLRAAVRHLDQNHRKKISVATGRRWLTHPVYRGDLHYNDGNTLRNTHAPILSREEAAQIDRWIRRNQSVPRRSASAPRSLSGLIFCRDCGQGLRILQVTQRQRRMTYLYLRCSTCGYSLNYNDVLQQMIETICRILPERIEGINSDGLDQARRGIDAELNQNDAILKQLENLQKSGILDESVIRQQRYQIEAAQSRLLDRLNQLPPQGLEELTQTLSIEPFWQDLTESERRSYFREFIRSAQIDPQGSLDITFSFDPI